jgi:hypothetical protein
VAESRGGGGRGPRRAWCAPTWSGFKGRGEEDAGAIWKQELEEFR